MTEHKATPEQWGHVEGYGLVVPDAYRLVRFRTEEGQVHLKLQGYFTWTQGWSQYEGEWRDLETVDADDLSDDKPYGQLSPYSLTS